MADVSFMDILGGATAPTGGETSMSESSDGTTTEASEPTSILESLNIEDIIEFLKSKEILPKSFTWKEDEGKKVEELPGEETTEDSLNFDKMMME